MAAFQSKVTAGIYSHGDLVLAQYSLKCRNIQVLVSLTAQSPTRVNMARSRCAVCNKWGRGRCECRQGYTLTRKDGSRALKKHESTPKTGKAEIAAKITDSKSTIKVKDSRKRAPGATSSNPDAKAKEKIPDANEKDKVAVKRPFGATSANPDAKEREEIAELLRLQVELQQATKARLEADERVLLLRKQVDDCKSKAEHDNRSKSSWRSWNRQSNWRPRRGTEEWHSWHNDGLN